MQKFTGRRIETKKVNIQEHSRLLIKEKKEESKMFSSEANQNWVGFVSIQLFERH